MTEKKSVVELRDELLQQMEYAESPSTCSSCRYFVRVGDDAELRSRHVVGLMASICRLPDPIAVVFVSISGRCKHYERKPLLAAKTPVPTPPPPPAEPAPLEPNPHEVILMNEPLAITEDVPRNTQGL